MSTNSSHRWRYRPPGISGFARFLFWLAVGGVFGLGVISILSIGILFLLAGLILLAVGWRWLGFGGAWAALIALGAVPSMVLAHAVLTAPPACVNSMQPGQSCEEVPAAWSGMAVAFGVVALIGVLSPLIRDRARLALAAAVASGLATIVWSVQPVINSMPNGQRCTGSSATGMHCTTLMSPSLVSQGDFGGVAITLAFGGAAALLIVGLTAMHFRFPQRRSLAALWALAGLLLLSGVTSGTVIASLPGILAVVAGLAASGHDWRHDAGRPRGSVWVRVERFLPGGGAGTGSGT